MSVTLVENQEIGGTWTKPGCNPSKFLLSQTKQCADAQHLKDDGIAFRLESIDPELLFHKKQSVVDTLRQRMEKALKSTSAEVIQGTARLLSANEVEITTASGIQKKRADVI